VPKFLQHLGNWQNTIIKLKTTGLNGISESIRSITNSLQNYPVWEITLFTPLRPPNSIEERGVKEG
jgi:hypothetical protein